MRSAKIRGTDYIIYEDCSIMSPKGVPVNTWKENNTGYHLFRIRVDNKPKCLRLHRIMAESFILNPDNMPFVKHKNDNKDVNLTYNLEWGTNKENTQEGYDNGCYEFKSRCHGVKATCNTTGEVFFYKSLRSLAEGLGLNRKNVAAVLKGKKNNTYPYTFEYDMEDKL
jgi:hypothetical protein